MSTFANWGGHPVAGEHTQEEMGAGDQGLVKDDGAEPGHRLPMTTPSTVHFLRYEAEATHRAARAERDRTHTARPESGRGSSVIGPSPNSSPALAPRPQRWRAVRALE